MIDQAASSQYPGIAWIRNELRLNLYSPVNHRVLAAYVTGSEARGEAKPDSDLDIAIIISPVKRLGAITDPSSLQVSEYYHGNFYAEDQVPRFNGRKIDFQFFYPEDAELKKIALIPIDEGEFHLTSVNP